MISIIQLVSHANVVVESHTIGAINRGILALVGIEKTDTEANAIKLLERIMTCRIFRDDSGKTNLSLLTIDGGLLLIPQFTLVADTNKGTRPGFSRGMPPEQGKVLFEFLVAHAKEKFPHVESGLFGAHMQINLCNDGPMTFTINC